MLVIEQHILAYIANPPDTDYSRGHLDATLTWYQEYFITPIEHTDAKEYAAKTDLYNAAQKLVARVATEQQKTALFKPKEAVK